MSRIGRVALHLFMTLGITTVLFSRESSPTPALTMAQHQYDSSLYSDLRWRMIGPFRGGRVNAVSGVPGQPNTFYFGSVGGGVWKSTNSGRTWAPIFDSQPIAS